MMASKRVTFLHAVNNFAVVGLLISPLVVSYWRGTWGLMDHYLVPDDVVCSPWVSVAIGIPLLVVLDLLQTPLQRLVRRTSPCAQHACHVLYIYVHGFANVNHWRGVWKLLDVYTGINPPSVAACVGLAVVAKVLMRTFHNALAPPILVDVDFKPNPFAISTRFKTNPGSFSWRFVLDVFFTIVVMGSLVVLFWRGTWEIFDLFLFPDDKLLTGLSCLAIGYGLYAVQTVLQYPAMVLMRRLKEHFFLRLALEDVFNLVSAVCAVSFWRGVWMTCDVLLLPGNPKLSLLVSHAVGTGTLYVICAGRSMLVTGCVLDGEAGGGEGFRLGQYLRVDDLLSQYLPQLSQEDGEVRQMDLIPKSNPKAAEADIVVGTSL